MLNIYQVGGSVRDEILNRPSNDLDWVVVGATIDEMLAMRYKQVGNDFPVFLHPYNGEEYALARTERKSGHGYNGFETFFDPSVTIEDDLLRRDLTINAIAKKDGEYVDPHGGMNDIQNRILRHVSDAFAEDPVRVLRVARFMAQLDEYDFEVADETKDLMRKIVQAGELNHLTAERVWKETEKALMSGKPSKFFLTLKEVGALEVIFPEVDALFGVPQTQQWHPEVDTGVHVMMVVDHAAMIDTSLKVRFAALVHDLGKALTPEDVLPGHHGHEKAGVPLTREVCERLKVPKEIKDFALMSTEFHGKAHKVLEMKPGKIHDLVVSLDGMRRPERFREFLLLSQCDVRGRLTMEDRETPELDFLHDCMEAMAKTDISHLTSGEVEPRMIGPRIRQERIGSVKHMQVQRKHQEREQSLD